MTTVLVSVAPSRVTDKLLGTEESFGHTRTAPVDHNAALGTIIYMISMSANVSVKVIELTEQRVVISYDYDISHMLQSIPSDDDPATANYHGWLYTVEKNPNDEMHGGVQAIIRTVYALCNTYRDICSREVAAWVAKEAGENDRQENENLRAALEYYGTSQAWQEDGKLVSAYNEDILRGQPWRIAHDALVNRVVVPLPQAVQRTIDQRGTVPEFLGRRPERA